MKCSLYCPSTLPRTSLGELKRLMPSRTDFAAVAAAVGRLYAKVVDCRYFRRDPEGCIVLPTELRSKRGRGLIMTMTGLAVDGYASSSRKNVKLEVVTTFEEA